MSTYDICIIGGGLAGLAAAYFIPYKYKVAVIEKENKFGGLLRSELVGKYLFDVGGSHIIFSKDKEIVEKMLKLLRENYITHRRNTKIYYKGRYVKYPFENGLKDLPAEERYECLRDLIYNYIRRIKGELPEPTNFYEWIYYVFGESIAEKYLIPYNEKLWKTNLREITLDWVGGRVPHPPIDDVIKAAVGLDVEGYVHQLIFHYPREGGIESLAKSLVQELAAQGVELIRSDEVKKIRISDSLKIVETAENEFKCKAVVYTAPLDILPNILDSYLSQELSAKLKELKSVPLSVIGLGYRGEAPPFHWVYFPHDNTLFHRIAFLSNYSSVNAPKGGIALITEVSFKNIEEMKSKSDDQIIDKVVSDLESVGIIRSSKDIEVAKVWRWDRAYIIYDINRAEIIDKVRTLLKEEGIFLHGRFGSWEYLNMDAVFKKSVKLAEEVSIYVGNSTRYQH
jgi:protoporphyrinogen oxidase